MSGPLNERQASYVADIGDATRHLAGLVDDVLALSAVEAGHVELRPEPVNLTAVLNSRPREWSAGAGRRGQASPIDVTGWATVEPVTVEADGRKVRQVVVNLLTNATSSSSPRRAGR